MNKKGEPWAAVTLEHGRWCGGVFLPARPHQTYGLDFIVADNIVLIKARVNMRDDSMMISANDLAVPDLASAGATKPVSLTLPARMCPDRVQQLKQVLTRHYG